MFWHTHYLSIYLSIICLHGDFTTIKMLNSLKVCHNQLLFFTQNNYMENYSHCCVYLYFIPFLLLSSIQWDEYTTVCLSSHSLKDIWSGLVPILSFYFWLLKLLWTSICKSLWGLMFLFLLDKYLWMELLGHMLILCLILWGTTQLFAKVVTQFYIPTSSIWECQFLYIFANTYYYILLVITILVSMKCYLVIFIDFSLMANDGETLLHSYLYVCLREMSIQMFCPFWNWVIWFLNYWVVEFFVCSRYNSLIGFATVLSHFAFLFLLPWWCSFKHRKF